MFKSLNSIPAKPRWPGVWMLLSPWASIGQVKGRYLVAVVWSACPPSQPGWEGSEADGNSPRRFNLFGLILEIWNNPSWQVKQVKGSQVAYGRHNFFISESFGFLMIFVVFSSTGFSSTAPQHAWQNGPAVSCSRDGDKGNSNDASYGFWEEIPWRRGATCEGWEPTPGKGMAERLNVIRIHILAFNRLTQVDVVY